MAELILSSVYKTYDNQVNAVSNINLHIKDKEFIVFVGPSGCGKSTTLRMIAGLEEISQGDFFIDGQRVNDLPPKDRNIAMVFQNYALYPHMTVFDNMAFALKLRKLPKSEINKRVLETATILGLENFLNRKPKELSGGQQQRVALGRAIVRNPKVFLMDEPLSNLDAKLRVQMRSEIIKLHNRLNTTTIYVTHDQTEAMTMANRLVIMNDGVVQQIGKPKEVYENPENIFVGGFIGSPPMNFLSGTLTDKYLLIGNLSVVVPIEKRALLRKQGFVGKKLILGIRPEDIHISTNQIDYKDDAKVSVKVDVAELTGSEIIIYCNLEGQPFIAKVSSNNDVVQGDMIELIFNLSKAHFFDPKTELRIR